jgi:hypothetical protein
MQISSRGKGAQRASDIDREIVMFMKVFDESHSWYVCTYVYVCTCVHRPRDCVVFDESHSWCVCVCVCGCGCVDQGIVISLTNRLAGMNVCTWVYICMCVCVCA